MADEHDLIVIGMGVGGEEVAGRAAESGMDVLSIERKLVGGECPYWGCIPSKIMVRAGNSVAEAFRATGLAGKVSISPEWAPVARRVREATAGWDDEIAVERHEKAGETFVRGSARFTAPNEVDVDGRTFKARRGIVVATGGEPAVPPIDGLRDVDFWTNREAIEATESPRSMVVLGAGPIGLELAQVYRRFGTEITIVELAEHALPMEEPENGDALAEVLREEGMTLHTGVSATSVKQSGNGIAVELEDGRVVEGETLLVATGRRLNLKELDLDNAGLDPDAKGIETDDHMRADDGIWAVET